MRNQNPLQRARDNVRKFVVRAEIQSYEFATLGKPDGSIVAPGVRNVYIVKDNNVATALNEANVPHNAGLPLKVRFEHNRWVVKGVDSRASAALLNLPGDPYGVPPHPLTTHNDVVITGLADGEVIAWDAALGAWVNASPAGGAVDSVNGQTGVVVLDADDIDDSATTNKFTSAAEITKLAGIEANADVTDAGNVGTAIDGSTVSSTMTTTDRIAAVIGGVLRYFTYGTIRDAIKSYYDSVVATLTNKIIDASANTLTNVNTSALSNDAVSNAKLANMGQGLVKGRQYGTGTGDPEDLTAAQLLTIIEAQALYALLAGRSGGQRITGIASTGYALEVYRDLTATSTDSPVLGVTQDHATDDQAALRVQQDGTGDILDLYDGATLVFGVRDGGRLDVYNIVRALTSSGLRLEDDGGNLGIFVDDGGKVVVGSSTSDGFNALQVVNAIGRVAIRSTNNSQNSGFSLYARGASGTEAGGGLFFTGHETSALRYLALSGDLNNNHVVITRDGNIGIGSNLNTPQGRLHAHDGTGGGLLVSKTGIVGSAVVIVPDGTGDVTKAVRIMGVASNSTPTTFDVSLYVANGGTGDITDGGGNTLRFAVAANGQLTVIRQAGAATWECSVWLAWK